MRVLLMCNLKTYFFCSVFLFLVFGFSASKGELKQSLSSIESGQGDVKKYARFISRDAAMKRVLKLSKGTPDRERTERLLNDLDWDIGVSQIRFIGNPMAGRVGEARVRAQLPFKLEKGDRITLRYHWSQNPRYQIEDAQGTSFVSLLGNNNLELQYFHRSGVDGGLDSLSSVVGFKVGSQPLNEGSEISFRISNLRLPFLVQSDFDLPIYIEKKGFLELKIPSNGFGIEPSETERISISVPSIVGLDEKFQASLRFEDKYGNLSQSNFFDLDILANGIFKKRFQTEENPAVISDLSFDSAGLNFIEARTGGGGLRAKSNPTLVGPYKERIVWMNFGPRTKISEGVLSESEINIATQGKYDIVSPVDHELYIFQPVSNRALRERGTLRNSFLEYEYSLNKFINVATPERTSRLRFQKADRLNLVQTFSGGSYYPWVLDRFARHGYQVGVLGSQFSLKHRKFENAIFSAVVLEENSSLIDALSSGSTYVAVDSKIILLNKSKNLSMGNQRLLEVEVVSNESIEEVQLYKNGALINTYQTENIETGKYNLELYSSSQPFSPVSSRPRNQREWLGRIKTSSGSLVAQQKNGWMVKQVGVDTVDFFTETHGLVKRLPFEITDFVQGTEIEILIAEGVESPNWLPVDRLPSQTPQDRFLISLGEMNSGASRTTRVNGYDDMVKVLPRRKALDRVVTYSYTDRSVPKLGDYYYFMARDEKGALAVSSPIFVGTEIIE